MGNLLPWVLTCILSRSARPWVLSARKRDPPDLNVPNLGIYVHVPFCRSLCSFCPYCKTLYDRGLAQMFTDALLKEIDLTAQAARRRPSVTSLYFGGGTPALVADRLGEITSAIRKQFDLDGPSGVELHPDDLEASVLYVIRQAGIDMVSIGVQSFQPHCLRALGREAVDAGHVRAALAGASFQTVDVDLIFGLPGQTGEDLAADFRTAVECGATQISTYPFITFTFSENGLRMPGKAAKRKLLASLIEVSEAVGFERTSVWTFAREGSQRYSSITRENYLGFGPSAVSLVGRTFRINTFDVEAYISRLSEGTLPAALSMAMSRRRRALYWLFWSSYGLHIDGARFRALFGQDVEEVFGLELAVASRLGLVERASGGYSLTDRGAYAFHLAEQAYTRQYIDKTWREARTCPWPRQIVLR